MSKKRLVYRKTLKEAGLAPEPSPFQDGWDSNELPDEVVELHESGIEASDWVYPNQSLSGNDFLREDPEEQELVFESEQVITHLLRKKAYAKIITLVSGNAREASLAQVQKQFSKAYAYDVSRNPAISFYTKLVERFGSDFSVEGTNLTLEGFGASDVPFLKSFASAYVPGMEEDSLIQGLAKDVGHMLNKYHAQRKKEQYKSEASLVTSRVSEVGIAQEGELNIESVNLQDDIDVGFDFLHGTQASLTVDDSMGLESIVDRDNMAIHVTDLNDKDIAQKLFDDGKNEDSARSWLDKEGFSDGRINDILLILRYLNAESGKKASLLDYSLDMGEDCEFRAKF